MISLDGSKGTSGIPPMASDVQSQLPWTLHSTRWTSTTCKQPKERTCTARSTWSCAASQRYAVSMPVFDSPSSNPLQFLYKPFLALVTQSVSPPACCVTTVISGNHDTFTNGIMHVICHAYHLRQSESVSTSQTGLSPLCFVRNSALLSHVLSQVFQE